MTYHHRPAIPRKDKEGCSYVEYGEASSFQAELWAAGGKLQAEQYGIRLPGIRNLRIKGSYTEQRESSGKTVYLLKDGPTLTLGDGVCLFVGTDEEPDYKIVAIYPYRLLTLEVEKT